MTSELDGEAFTLFSCWYWHRAPRVPSCEAFKAGFDQFKAGKVVILRVKPLHNNKTMVEMGYLDE